MDQEALEAIRQTAAQVQTLTNHQQAMLAKMEAMTNQQQTMLARMEAMTNQQQATNAQQKAMLNREAEQASTIRNLQESHEYLRAEAREAVNATAQRAHSPAPSIYEPNTHETHTPVHNLHKAKHEKPPKFNGTDIEYYLRRLQNWTLYTNHVEHRGVLVLEQLEGEAFSLVDSRLTAEQRLGAQGLGNVVTVLREAYQRDSLARTGDLLDRLMLPRGQNETIQQFLRRHQTDWTDARCKKLAPPDSTSGYTMTVLARLPEETFGQVLSAICTETLRNGGPEPTYHFWVPIGGLTQQANERIQVTGMVANRTARPKKSRTPDEELSGEEASDSDLIKQITAAVSKLATKSKPQRGKPPQKATARPRCDYFRRVGHVAEMCWKKRPNLAPEGHPFRKGSQ